MPIETETAFANVLSEVQQIRELPAERAVRDIPVNIRAVGSHYGQSEALLFLQNDEAGILAGTVPLLVWSIGVLGISVCFALGWILSSRRRVRANSAELLIKNRELHRSGDHWFPFEKNPDPIWVLDWDTLAFLAVNEAAIQQYGYSRKEFLRITLNRICRDEELLRVLEARKKPAVSNEGMFQGGASKLSGKDGTVIDVDITTKPIHFNQKRAWLVLAHDVTERRGAPNDREAMLRLAAVDVEVGNAFRQDRGLQEILNGSAEALVRHLEAAQARIWTLSLDSDVLESTVERGNLC